MSLNSTKTPEQVFPRNDPSSDENNPCGYNEVQLKARDAALLAMMKDYPRLPQLWCEWIYDFCTTHPEEEVHDIINSGRWKKPSTRNNEGGDFKCMEVLTPEEYRELYGETAWEKKKRELDEAVSKMDSPR